MDFVMNNLLHNPALGRVQSSLCTRCFQKPLRRSAADRSLRFLSTPSRPVPSSGITPLPHRRLVRLSGHDAPKFLQGLTTNNVDPSRRSGWYSAFLNAQGRVLWEGFVYPTSSPETDWSCLLEVEGSEIKNLLSHLKRHKLRSKVSITEVDAEEISVWAAWMELPDPLKILKGDRASNDSPPKSPIIHLKDPRLANFSHRFLLSSAKQSKSDLPDSFAQLDMASPEDYILRRWEHAIPEGPLEIVPTISLPHKSNLDLLNAIDFRKGCYVGQELTIRTQHTGVVRKRLLPVEVSSTEADVLDVSTISRGASIKPAGSTRAAATWLVGKYNVGLAECTLAKMTDLEVSPEGGSYVEGQEFALVHEGLANIKVKAHVPDWLREKVGIKNRGRAEAVPNVQ
jgi:transferase CAF17, mitochondrial